MRTHYLGHDDIYKKNKASGKAGWDSAETSAEVTQQFTELLAHEAIPKDCRLLELGCGAGNLSVGFARLGYQVTGVDIAPSAVEWARERAQQEGLEMDLLVDNVVTLGELRDGDFPLAIDSHCLHCIIGEDRARFLGRVRELLTTGGIFVVNTMVQNARTVEVRGFDRETGVTVHGDLATRFIGTREHIEAELKAAGYTILESQLVVDDETADDLLLICRRAV